VGNLRLGPGENEARIVLNLIRALAVILLIVALARPQSSFTFADTSESGRDIMLTLDLSGSMRALDYYIDGERVERLEALKLVVKDFIRERSGDRMGLVVFGSEVHTQSPLTSDTGALIDIVDSLQVSMAGDGTAIGDGLTIALKRLSGISGASKIVVLVTDGAQTAGVINPRQAAAIAKSMGIKVHTIGIGGDKPAPIRITGLFGESLYRYIPAERDEGTLRAVAEITGGQYFQGENLDKLKEIYGEISKIEERITEKRDFVLHEEHFLPWLLVGLAALLLHELLRSTIFRTVPS
jgi:Ca-activated chloride channel family protein